jgi:drug/metabolite transporter (DMT)-like permease
VLACLLATVCYAHRGQRHQALPERPAAAGHATGSQLGATLALALPRLWLAGADARHAGLAGARVLGVLCTGIAYVLYFRLIEQAGPRARWP